MALVQHGADVNLKNAEALTALDEAKESVR